MRRYRARILAALCVLLLAVGLAGCGKGDAESGKNGEQELTQEYVCSQFGIAESEFEGVDFDDFVDYYGLTYENIQDESVEYLLRQYKENGGEPASYDYGYMYDGTDGAALTAEDEDSVSVVFLAQNEDDLHSFWIFDFDKGIKLAGGGSERVIGRNSVTAALTQEHKEQVLALFEKYDVYAWYENGQRPDASDWYLSVQLQDGTVALTSGAAGDPGADFAGLLSEIRDIGE